MKFLIILLLIVISCESNPKKVVRPKHIAKTANWNGESWIDSINTVYQPEWEYFSKEYKSILLKAHENLELKDQYFRFIMNRSFHNTIVLNLNFSENILTVKKINDIDVFQKRNDKTLIVENSTIKLDRSFLDEFNRIKFFGIESLKKYPKEYYGELGEMEILYPPQSDGSNWFLEAKINDKYHFVYRPSPDNEKFVKFCIKLIRLYSLEEEIY